MTVTINMTYQGRSANYVTKMDPGLDDASIRRICEEAVQAGEVPGLTRGISKGAFRDCVIDRFNYEDGVRFFLRPKVPFG